MIAYANGTGIKVPTDISFLFANLKNTVCLDVWGLDVTNTKNFNGTFKAFVQNEDTVIIQGLEYWNLLQARDTNEMFSMCAQNSKKLYMNGIECWWKMYSQFISFNTMFINAGELDNEFQEHVHQWKKIWKEERQKPLRTAVVKERKKLDIKQTKERNRKRRNGNSKNNHSKKKNAKKGCMRK